MARGFGSPRALSKATEDYRERQKREQEALQAAKPKARLIKRVPIEPAPTKAAERAQEMSTIEKLLGLEPGREYTATEIREKCEAVVQAIWYELETTIAEVCRKSKIKYSTFYSLRQTGHFGYKSGPALNCERGEKRFIYKKR